MNTNRTKLNGTLSFHIEKKDTVKPLMAMNNKMMCFCVIGLCVYKLGYVSLCPCVPLST